MYEHQTFEAIMKRMLDRVSANVDKREGSLIYDALAPDAAELAQIYVELDIIENLSYADTASGGYLTRHAAGFGVIRRAATKAQRTGLFFAENDVRLDVPIGSIFVIDDLKYEVLAKQAAGEYVMRCFTVGVVGNQRFGVMLPLEYHDNLVRAELADVLVPGDDEESDESLRARFYEENSEKAFGGNIADYKEKVGEIPGVGGVKVFRAWKGGGTVKCTIIASDFSQPSATLIDNVQTIIDPEVNQGEGLGVAPIGHVVTIAGVSGVVIDVDTTVTLAAGTTLGAVQSEIEGAIAEYLLSLRAIWKNQEQLVVRVSQIDARILLVPGVVDVGDTQINGLPANAILTEEQIPVRGAVTVHE